MIITIDMVTGKVEETTDSTQHRQQEVCQAREDVCDSTLPQPELQIVEVTTGVEEGMPDSLINQNIDSFITRMK